MEVELFFNGFELNFLLNGLLDFGDIQVPALVGLMDLKLAATAGAGLVVDFEGDFELGVLVKVSFEEEFLFGVELVEVSEVLSG